MIKRAKLPLPLGLVALCFACSAEDAGDANVNPENLTQAIAIGTPGVTVRIEAEAYDDAHETTATEYGDCGNGDGVDIETTTDPNGGGCNIGWTSAGEYLVYEVENEQAKRFNITARVASNAGLRDFYLVIDGEYQGMRATPNSGWQSFEDRTWNSVLIPAGRHTVKIVFVDGLTNLNYLELAVADNLFANPNFDTDLSGWSTFVGYPREDSIRWNEVGADGMNGSAHFYTDGSTNTIWNLQLRQVLPVLAGESYTLGFDIATTSGNARNVQIYAQQNGGDYTTYGARTCAVPAVGVVRCEVVANISEIADAKFGIQGADNLWDFTVDNASLVRNSPTGHRPWIVQFGTEASEEARASQIDSAGDLIVAGTTEGDLAGTGFAGEVDAFVTKRSSVDGSAIWTKQFGTVAYDDASGVAADANGDVVVVGTTFDALNGPSLGDADAFATKLSGVDGSVLWARQIGTDTEDSAFSTGIDAAGDVFITGHTLGQFAGTSNLGDADFYVIKLSGETGDTLWVKQFGSPGYDSAYSLSVSNTGDVFVGGDTSSSLEGPGSLGSLSSAFAMKVSGATGALLWVNQFTARDSDLFGALAADPAGDVVVTGYRSATDSREYTEPFVMKLAGATGATVWSMPIIDSLSDPGRHYTYPYAVAVGPTGNVFVGGDTEGDVEGSGNTEGADAFVLQLSPTGTLLGANQFGSSDEVFVNSIALDSADAVFLTGYAKGEFAGTVNWGIYDAFSAKLLSPIAE